MFHCLEQVWEIPISDNFCVLIECLSRAPMTQL